MPEDVQGEIGYALHLAQLGEVPLNARPLKGFSGVSVMEVSADFATDTYRGVYTAKFSDVVYVLHCFQKKSKRGIQMTQSDQDLIRQRLKAAEIDYKAAEIDYQEKYGKRRI